VKAWRQRDREQTLARERERPADVPALEAEAGVPVEVAGVRPVAADDVLDPGAEQTEVILSERRHSGAQGLLVPDDEVTGHVRVLGAVEVQPVIGGLVRQVVEPVARAQIG
jgi:hypothetical protein